MMKSKFAILRAVTSAGPRDSQVGGFSIAKFAPPSSGVGTFGARAAQGPEQIRLDVEELSSRDVRLLSQDPSVAAIARVMPTKLIAPVDVAGGNALGEAWGVSAVGADTTSRTGAGVVVAVLDTGIDASHAAFDGVHIVKRNFTGGNDGDGDVNGHGTHCAGTIFGRDVDGKRIGVARGVTEARIAKVLDDLGGGTSIGLFEGMQWAINQGAHVISMSLGLDYPGLVAQLTKQGMAVNVATSLALEAYRANIRAFDTLMAFIASQVAFGAGALVVAAAGNESSRPETEISVSVPAAANDVISVGAAGRASRNSLVVAPFSNTQPTLTAPGVQVLSAKTGGGLTEKSGTSMATPHVAGVAALWWEELSGTPAATPDGVAARLRARARADVFAAGTDPSDRGEGLVSCPP